MKTVTVIIADDHPIIRKAIRITLKKKPFLNFIGEADNGIELKKLIEKKIPDIAIIDLEMPKMNGYDTILEIHTKYPEIKIVVLSGFLNEINQQRAINLGASATVSKAEPINNLIKAVEMTIKGKSYHSKVSDAFYVKPIEERDYNLLTIREKQILNLIAAGKTSKQISKTYNISKLTVDKHRSNIREKLGLKNLAEMIQYAINNRTFLDE